MNSRNFMHYQKHQMAESDEDLYDKLKELSEFDNTKSGVKGLSDSGVTTIPKFFIHPPETLIGLHSTATASIPTVDFTEVNSRTGRSIIVKQVKDAASTWGFFQIINHEIPQSILNRTIAAVKSFHEQPPEVKSCYYSRDETKPVMYASNNDLHRSKAAAWHDSLSVWMAPTPATPEELPLACREEVLEWDARATSLGEVVLELLSEGLGLEKGKFKELTFMDKRAFVGHTYPFCPQADITVGLTSHTDPGVITILLQNQVNGLQVKHNQEWVNVKTLPRGLIVNIGDFLQIASNGEYKSVEHRVVANCIKEARISIAMFLGIEKWKGDGYFGPLPELLNARNPSIYRDFTMKEFMENFYGKGLDTKSLINNLKLQK